jgi:hypothetical protein
MQPGKPSGWVSRRLFSSPEKTQAKEEIDEEMMSKNNPQLKIETGFLVVMIYPDAI